MKKPVKVILIVCVVLCLALLGGCIANSFGAFDDVKLTSAKEDKVRNEQNLLDPDFYTSIVSGDQKGVKVTVNDDGSITLDGTATGKSNLRLFEISDYAVNGLTLTIGSVDFGEDAENSCLLWRHGGGSDGVHYYELYSGDSETFTINYADSQNYNFYLSIVEGDEFDNVTIYPVLNYGVTAVSYFE